MTLQDLSDVKYYTAKHWGYLLSFVENYAKRGDKRA